ncbi:hypothetical protein ACIBM8_20065 [Micromonospora aurantiaca]|uniref:hypothetical protein n=1 Tax=Micromonospora aurantiaca (nom. illeg.) TaxID=47850 RepID=UPI0037A8D091
MNATAAYALGLVLIGGPASMLAPLAVARRLVERHAHRVADDIARLPRLDATATRRELINR